MTRYFFIMENYGGKKGMARNTGESLIVYTCTVKRRTGNGDPTEVGGKNHAG